MFLIFFLALTLTAHFGCCENVKLSINGKYLDYVAEVVDKVFVEGYGSTLVGKDLPGASGTVYKIENLVMDKIDLGKSAGELNNNSILLSLNNASASVSGSYEAYTFWTTTGNLTLDLAGSLHLQVVVGDNNTLNMTSCTANYTLIDLDLQKSSVNWLAPILKPVIESTVQDILCNLVDTYMINMTNTLIADLPEEIPGPGGEVSMKVEEVKINDETVDLAVQIGKDKDTSIAGFSTMAQDMCIQAREGVFTSLSKVFLPPGRISTTIDIIALLYGENTTQKDKVNLEITNNSTLRVGFDQNHKFLAALAVESDIQVKRKEGGERESLGHLGMGGTLEAQCSNPGQTHIAQYAINKLIPANKYIKLTGFNLGTTRRSMVGCSNMKLKNGFLNELLEKVSA